MLKLKKIIALSLAAVMLIPTSMPVKANVNEEVIVEDAEIGIDEIEERTEDVEEVILHGIEDVTVLYEGNSYKFNGKVFGNGNVLCYNSKEYGCNDTDVTLKYLTSVVSLLDTTGSKLLYSVDYTISYDSSSENTIGQHTATFTGIGDFACGTKRSYKRVSDV